MGSAPFSFLLIALNFAFMFVAHYALFLIFPARARSLAQGQYQFVYETLLEYTRGIDSRFPVNVLAEKIKERGIKDKKTKKNAYQMEFLVRVEGGWALDGHSDTDDFITDRVTTLDKTLTGNLNIESILHRSEE